MRFWLTRYCRLSQEVRGPCRYPLCALLQVAPIQLRGNRVLPTAVMPPAHLDRQRVYGSGGIHNRLM
jgi:hypothetical protein